MLFNFMNDNARNHEREEFHYLLREHSHKHKLPVCFPYNRRTGFVLRHTECVTGLQQLKFLNSHYFVASRSHSLRYSKSYIQRLLAT
jgi:hypothetical protein